MTDPRSFEDAAHTDASLDVEAADVNTDTGAPLLALGDFSIGPHPSAIALIQRSIASNARAAVLGFAANADAPGGNPALFDLARSALVTSRLCRFDVALDAGAKRAVSPHEQRGASLHRGRSVAVTAR